MTDGGRPDAAEIQKQVDATGYWDMDILDLRISFFGDEVELFIADGDSACWDVVFSGCSKVSYETDAGWGWKARPRVRDMRKPQLGYYGQDISVRQGRMEGFYEVDMDLSIMKMNLVCMEITVCKIPVEEAAFFWQR